MRKYALALVACAALTGCLSSGPEKPLESMAKALTERDVATFLAQMDVKRFASNEVHTLTQNNSALGAIDAVGKFLGLGGMDDILGQMVDTQEAAVESFTRGVSTGELVQQCTKSPRPDCPWVPESLRAAKVKTLSDTTAVAQVTTPAGMTSWLALAKEGDVWKVVGHAVLEKDAVTAAAGELVTPQSGSSKSSKSSKSVKSETPATDKSKSESKQDDAYAPAPPPTTQL